MWRRDVRYIGPRMVNMAGGKETRVGVKNDDSGNRVRWREVIHCGDL